MASIASNQINLFQQMLGIRVSSEQEIVSLVKKQLPLTTLSQLMRHGLSREEIGLLIIHPRTLKHRRSKKQALSVEESERAVRVGRILALAQSVLGNAQSALDWLRTPKKRFNGDAPMHLLSTEAGGRMVEEMLVQIDEGMFA